MKNLHREETFYFDYSSEIIQGILLKIGRKEGGSDLDFAIRAYTYVRDYWPYYPYRFSLQEEDWRSSKIAQQKTGHCLDKSILLISLLRAVNIPAKLGLSRVRNHIAVEQIVEKFGSDELVPHGYVAVFLEGIWVKATPAFNKELCLKMGVHALDFDGKTDAVFQEFDAQGTNSFMEYLEDYGTFDTVPLEYMFQLMCETYPMLLQKGVKMGDILDLSLL
ncbi:MAG: transglutaminase family protein [Flavobacteriaceae bacterium]|nr:transglutaminase family protein [Flavobacteriaceae bacterium]